MTDVLSRRVLNRSFLARQLLLERASLSAGAAIEHLVGLQAQSPTAPYFGLRARLDGFEPAQLSRLIEDRKAVRIALMRSTIHLVSARDCIGLRPVMQSAVERSLSNYRKEITGIDREGLLAHATKVLEEKPRTGIELEKELAKRWRSRDPHALAMAVRCWLPLVQVTPRALWGRSGAAAHTTSEAWLGRPLAASDKPDRVFLRYLRAFGPASIQDFQTWSGLTGASEIVERARRKLRTFRDENGTELYDVVDGRFVEPDTPVPPIFVPEYDNSLLSHADRSRIIERGYRNRIFTKGGLLVDGFVIGRWWIATRPKKVKDLVVEPFEKLPRNALSDVEEEGDRVLAFAADENAGKVAIA
jgi:hypothetical protein